MNAGSVLFWVKCRYVTIYYLSGLFMLKLRIVNICHCGGCWLFCTAVWSWEMVSYCLAIHLRLFLLSSYAIFLIQYLSMIYVKDALMEVKYTPVIS